ncbi:GNAT family N-acetyltransferase [Gordonibacter massiliensis (ex Traore et al. 2017)]|uniref:GNAT family N-acetyltransferase n=1 Tax=Gordonibacter massiliensis (ex Traore et al. 2017) TaxID=1841863 RepID=A0A842JE08_9ACTN|nr:GNAT family N-acetyltransferase [Gordonibacter massiliensis (ex Traore et al. 2017)]MBC2890243.1 GNAT family N-acetyltransferase [Gordonibacter massiliensis (ex Traore et al. 2017)]
MTDELFTIRDARADDKPVLDAYANAEGMDAIPDIEGVRVAVNGDDEVVGFIRIALDEEDGTAFVNPVITHETWRGYGVGRALMDEALARHGELRLVSRGGSLPFYEALGYERIGWDLIKMALVDDCDHCELRDECGPVPMRKRLD